MTPFSAIITPQSVSFTAPDGKVHNVVSSHEKWDEIIAAIKKLQSSIREEADGLFENEYGSPEECHAELAALLDETKHIVSAGAGRVSVISGVVYYGDEAVRTPLTNRIIQGLAEGFDMSAYMLFLDNSMENPSKRAVDEMYSFMERNNMGITSDGYILGYKKVKEDFTDIYTGKIDNSPGSIVEMRRNMVDDNANQTCSKGLHFCSMSYLPHYGSSRGNKIVIVKVNPKDIVSVPIDYDHAKVRCCRYEVVSEYTGPDTEDLLGSKAVWFDSDFDESDDFYETDDYDNFDEDDGDYNSDDSSDDDTEIVVEEDLAFLSEEGEDMRHIIDTMESPTTEEGAVMRSLIDVVEGVEVSPVEHDTVAPPTNPLQDAFTNLVDAIIKAQTQSSKK